MREGTANLDAATVAGFGQEWARFDQSGMSTEEANRIFESYFSIFPWATLPAGAIGFDAGCGSGRWAALAASRVGRLHCVDASRQALGVARRRLATVTNVEIHEAPIGAMPIADGTMDFGYSLGVLHHLPDPAAGLSACVQKLKRGAPMLIYIYYAFDNRPQWFRLLWQVTDAMRLMISRLPFWLRSAAAELIAAVVYWPVARVAALFERSGRRVENWPLNAYRRLSYYAMRTDALDRFGTRLEHRMTRNQIEAMMTGAGLGDIGFSEASPYWCAVGRRL